MLFGCSIAKYKQQKVKMTFEKESFPHFLGIIPYVNRYEI